MISGKCVKLTSSIAHFTGDTRVLESITRNGCDSDRFCHRRPLTHAKPARRSTKGSRFFFQVEFPQLHSHRTSSFPKFSISHLQDPHFLNLSHLDLHLPFRHQSLSNSHTYTSTSASSASYFYSCVFLSFIRSFGSQLSALLFKVISHCEF